MGRRCSFVLHAPRHCSRRCGSRPCCARRLPQTRQLASRRHRRLADGIDHEPRILFPPLSDASVQSAPCSDCHEPFRQYSTCDPLSSIPSSNPLCADSELDMLYVMAWEWMYDVSATRSEREYLLRPFSTSII